MPGTQDAFARQLMEDWQSPIFNYALRWLREPSDAEDATQEIFIAILRDRRDLRSSEALKAWIYKLASRVLIKHKERGRRRRDRFGRGCEALAAAALEPRQAIDVEAEERRRVLHQSVAELPDRIRAAVMLKYFQGLTQQEVAEALELPRSTVRDRIKKGLELLRENLALSGAAAVTPKLEALLATAPMAPVPSSLSSLLANICAAPSRAALVSGGLMTTKLKAGLGILALGLIGFGLTQSLTPATPKPFAPEPRARADSSAMARAEPREPAAVAVIPERQETGDVPAADAPTMKAMSRAEQIKAKGLAILERIERGGALGDGPEAKKAAAAVRGLLAEAKAGSGAAGSRPLWITVVDQETGAPVDEASVYFKPLDEVRSVRPYQETEGGRLLIKGAKQGSYELFVRAEGYIAFACDRLKNPVDQAARIDVDADLIDAGLTIAMIRGATLTGEVRAADQSPVEAAITVLQDNDFKLRRAEAKTRDGRFEVANMSAGRFLVVAKAEGLPPAMARIEIRNGVSPPPLSLTLGRPVHASGRVVDGEGRGIAGARIEAMPATKRGPSLPDPDMDDHAGRRVSAVSDEDGRFELRGLEAGEIDLLVLAPGFVGATRRGLAVPCDPSSLNFALAPGGRLEVRVLESDGRSPGYASLSLRQGGLWFRSPRLTDGRHRFEGLPAGPYELQVYTRSGRETRAGVRAGEEALTVTLGEGLRVIGRVETPPGGPKVSSLQVYPASAPVPVDADGAFSVTLSESEPRDLSFSAAGYLSMHVSRPKVSPGEAYEVVVKLRLASAASGQILDAAGRPAGALRIRAVYSEDAFYEVGADTFGRFRFDGLEPGAVSFEVRWPKDGKETVSRLPAELIEGVESKGLILRLE